MIPYTEKALHRPHKEHKDAYTAGITENSQHVNGAGVLSSNTKNSKRTNFSRSDASRIGGHIDDRTITRGEKGYADPDTTNTRKEQDLNRHPTYRTQSAKTRDTSR